jgi:hypothetical protein
MLYIKNKHKKCLPKIPQVYFSNLNFNNHKIEAPIMDRGPNADFIFKSHTFLRHVSMKAIDDCLKLKLSGIGSSILHEHFFSNQTF